MKDEDLFFRFLAGSATKLLPLPERRYYDPTDPDDLDRLAKERARLVYVSIPAVKR